MSYSLFNPLRAYVLLGTALALLAAPILPNTAEAGCGCDHPPPQWAPVMPYFAPGGARVRVWAKDTLFEVGRDYQVSFGSVQARGTFEATDADFIDVTVPADAKIGPASIEVYYYKRVWWWREKHTTVKTDNSEFTVLPAFVKVAPRDGVFRSGDFQVAVDSNGTVLLPLDLSSIMDAYQFGFQFEGLRLNYGAEDVVFYSKDGVDLTLFTLTVDDSTKRQWGSYYGWNVDEDHRLYGLRFNDRSASPIDLRYESDILTYWRHEFHTYQDAHMPGGSHETNGDGFHKDSGTLHIDHDRIVLAISGKERDYWFPESAYLEKDLKPGSRTVKLKVAMMQALLPVEPGIIIEELDSGTVEPLETVVSDDLDAAYRASIEANSLAATAGAIKMAQDQNGNAN